MIVRNSTLLFGFELQCRHAVLYAIGYQKVLNVGIIPDISGKYSEIEVCNIN